MATSEYCSCPPRLPTPTASHVAIASGVNHRVTSPRWTSARSYAGQFPTRYFVLYLGCTLDFTSRSCPFGRHDGQGRDEHLLPRTNALPSRSVVRFYNTRGTAEQWIKEGKQATHWTRLSCHRFRANEVRLQLSVLAYTLGNLWRRLVLPPRIKRWSLTSLQQRLVKTGGRLVKHARYDWLLLAEGHLTRRLFGDMLRRIWALPVPAG